MNSVRFFTSSDSVCKIATFDSGIGGYHMTHGLYDLCVNQSLTLKPHEIIHIADILNLPYGQKSPAEIISCVTPLAKQALEQGCDYFLICCNTASVHADAIIASLAQQGIEDAFLRVISLKSLTYQLLEDFCTFKLQNQPQTHLLFLATSATIRSGNYLNHLLSRYACVRQSPPFMQKTEHALIHHFHYQTPWKTDFYISQMAPNRWVSALEKTDSLDKLLAIIEEDLNLLTAHMPCSLDGVGLFCTHYPLIYPLIESYLLKEKLSHPQTHFFSQNLLLQKWILQQLKQPFDEISKSKSSPRKIFFTAPSEQDYAQLLTLFFNKDSLPDFIFP